MSAGDGYSISPPPENLTLLEKVSTLPTICAKVKADLKGTSMSSVAELYHDWAEQLTALVAWQRPEHRKVLAWLMVAIDVGKDVRWDRSGLNLPREAKHRATVSPLAEAPGHGCPLPLREPVAWQVGGNRRCRRLRIQIDLRW